MAALMAHSPESFVETRERVLGTRNGTVKNRYPQIPLESRDCPSQAVLLPTPATHLRSFEEDETDGSDDELFLARYTQTNSRHTRDRHPQEPAAAASRSRPQEPPVTPGAHGPARLSPSDSRTRVAFWDPSGSAAPPLIPHGSVTPETSFTFSHSKSSSDTQNPTGNLPRGPAQGLLFPRSCSAAAGANGEESLERHRRRVLGAKQGAIGEKNLGERPSPFQRLQGCPENRGLVEGELIEEEEDEEWEESCFETGANLPVLQAQRVPPGAGVGSRPSTAGTGGKPVVDQGPTGANYLRARTFQGRNEQPPPFVAYQRSQTTALWGNRGPTQKAVNGMPRALSTAAREFSLGGRCDSPQGVRAVVGVRIMHQGERADSPNLMRRVVEQQGGMSHSSSPVDLSRLSGPRQARSAFAREGAFGSGRLSPESRPLVQKSATQRQSIENRCSGAVVSLPRSCTVDARVGGGAHKDARLRPVSPTSVSARYTSALTRMGQDTSPLRSMSPGVYALRHGVGGVAALNQVERLGGHGSPSQGRTSYSRQMAQAAAAARERRMF